jgi:hypothetical protein
VAVIDARALSIAVLAVLATACGRPSLPDWSGIWLPDIEDQFKQIDSNPLPWKPEVAAEVQAADGSRGRGAIRRGCSPTACPRRCRRGCW